MLFLFSLPLPFHHFVPDEVNSIPLEFFTMCVCVLLCCTSNRIHCVIEGCSSLLNIGNRTLRFVQASLSFLRWATRPFVRSDVLVKSLLRVYILFPVKLLTCFLLFDLFCISNYGLPFRTSTFHKVKWIVTVSTSSSILVLLLSWISSLCALLFLTE